MDSNTSTAAFMHRSGVSSSASSAGTGSSIGGGPTQPGGSGRMAVIGVTRNVRLRRRGASGFGFSLRGGREYAAGFYVSDVQPGGEAHRNGLRVGDQIIRVNGYPVEDAVHQEVALLAKNQQVLVLKIQSVGIIPVKNNPNDPVTWHMVQQQQQQVHYNEPSLGPLPSTEVRIRILVGEMGRLGCGVCKGIVPGLTVQGTREGGPARAAGLKAGDIIIWCNGQRLTDIPFEKAIEVMRSSAVLDLVVHRPPINHLYDCPESVWMRGSSGYDSETSSLTNASPPPPPQQNFSSSPQHYHHHHPADGRFQPRYRQDDVSHRNSRICCPLALSRNSCSSSEWDSVDQAQEWSRKPNNTTVIRVNQNQNQNQNQRPYGCQQHNTTENYEENVDNEPLYDPVAPRIGYEEHDFDVNPRNEADPRLGCHHGHMRQQDDLTADVIYDGPAVDLSTYHESKKNDQEDLQVGEMPSEVFKKTVTTVEIHQTAGPPAPPLPLTYKWPTGEAPDIKPINSMGMQMGSTMSMGSTGSTETESSLESSCSKDSASTSSSLSSSSCEPPPTVSFGSGPTISNVSHKTAESTRNITARTSPIATTDLGTAIAQELQRRAQQRNINNTAKAESCVDKASEVRKPQTSDLIRSQEQKVTHDKLMEEFKRAHRKMFSNSQPRVQFSDQTSEQAGTGRRSKRTLTQDKEKQTLDCPSLNVPPPPVPPAPPAPLKGKCNEESVEMQSIESFKLKDSPSAMVPRAPATYFPMSSTSTITESGSPCYQPLENKTQINGKDHASFQGSSSDMVNKHVANTAATSKTINGKALTGKVAIKIGAYEGEVKQPSKLEFLSQQIRTAEKNSTEEPSNYPVTSRLQNELVATLQRSNLRKKTEEENQCAVKTIHEASKNVAHMAMVQPQPGKLQWNTVDRLATALGNKVTIKVNPQNDAR